MYTLHPPSVLAKRFPTSPNIQILPVQNSQDLKAVGPGRLERAYQTQVARLSRELHAIQEAQVCGERKLGTASLVERGTQRYVDRIEAQVQRREAKSRRALVLVGTLQQDNQILQARVQQLENRLKRLAAPQTSTLAQRVLSRLGMGGHTFGHARQSS
jgi:hypothetical protein